MLLNDIPVVQKQRQEEKKLEKSIIRWLEKNLEKGSYLYYKNWGGSGFSRSGRPDIEIAYKGQIFYFELKDPNGQLSTVQKAVIEKYKKTGITIFVVDSLDLFLENFIG